MYTYKRLSWWGRLKFWNRMIDKLNPWDHSKLGLRLLAISEAMLRKY